MKRYFVWILLLFLLSGCDTASRELDAAMELRSKILQSDNCSFTTEITADYGDQIHRFKLACTKSEKDSLSFSVAEPDTISGISGRLTGDGGQIVFDDVMLHFPYLADGLLSPISAPWILMNALQSGFLTSACTENQQIHISIEDSFENEQLYLDVWLDEGNVPVQADILYEERRILTLSLKNFEIS